MRAAHSRRVGPETSFLDSVWFSCFFGLDTLVISGPWTPESTRLAWPGLSGRIS